MTPSLPRRSAVSTVTSPPKPDTSFIVKTPNETYELADSHIPASNLAALSGHVPHDPLLPSSAVGLPSTPQEFGRVDITGLVKTPASSKSLSCLSLFLICFCYGRWCSPSGTKITQSSELQAQQAKQTMAKTKSKKNRKDKKSEKTVKNRPQTAMLVGKSGSGIKGPSVPFINCQSCFELKHSTNGGTDIGEKAMRQATVYREIQMDRSAQWAEDYSDQVQSPNNVTLMQSREDAQNPADLLRAAKLSLLDIKSAVIYRDLVDPSTWLHDALVKYLEQSAGVLVLGCRLESRPVMKGTTQEIKKDALEIGSTVGAVRVLVVATRQLTVRDLISKCSRKSTASSLGNNAYIKNDRSCELKASAGRAKADDKQEENIVEEYIKNGAKSSVRKMEVREVEKHELCTNIKENESDSLFSLKMETGCTLQNPSTDHPTGELSIKDSNRGPQSSIPSSSSIAQELEAVFASDLAGTRLTRLGLQGIRLEVSLEDEEVEQALLELES
ncbi:unnamed protein product [Protopolystoma xenopodis]|uniref:Uncharacterized protein n=1 Tax=Protopolystoma xenopodis TaxID=117903 RepID=A0A3S5FBR5_9PLAT|nr:unnamed protein product [Protopolystoma xenopodis]